MGIGQNAVGAKEQTILEVSLQIRGRLAELQNRLDAQFNRVDVKEAGSEVRPQEPNVLDEISGVLNDDMASVNAIIDQLYCHVLLKIS